MMDINSTRGSTVTLIFAAACSCVATGGAADAPSAEPHHKTNITPFRVMVFIVHLLIQLALQSPTGTRSAR
jgi:uncharacterized membrane protein YsdA (DUF1294 family)